MNRWILAVLFATLSLTGCTFRQSHNQFVAAPTVQAGDPSFVVVPFNSLLDQERFASWVEGAIIGVGYRVVNAPRGEKSVEVRSGATAAAGRDAEAVQAATKETTERYVVALRDVSADFIVETTYATPEKFSVIRVIERESEAVLSSAYVVAYSPDQVAPKVAEIIEQLELQNR